MVGFKTCLYRTGASMTICQGKLLDVMYVRCPKAGFVGIKTFAFAITLYDDIHLPPIRAISVWRKAFMQDL